MCNKETETVSQIAFCFYCFTNVLERFTKWDVLLQKAVQEGFNVIITIDKNLQYQQHIEQHDIILVVFDSPSSSIKDVKQFIPIFESQILSYEKGKTYLIMKE